MNLLKELKELNLPVEDFAIFGSGPMAIRGLRENDDLDIIVKKELWEKLSKKYPVRTKNEGRTSYIQIGGIEIFKNWKPWFESTEELIDEADIIQGIRFVRLERVIKWKKAMGRDKDFVDIEKIEEYMSKDD